MICVLVSASVGASSVQLPQMWVCLITEEILSAVEVICLMWVMVFVALTSRGCFVGFREMLAASNASSLRRSGKKHGKHSTSSTMSSAYQAGTQFIAPVIASGARGGTMNSKDDTTSGLSSGNKAAKIRQLLAKLNPLPAAASRYSMILLSLSRHCTLCTVIGDTVA